MIGYLEPSGRDPGDQRTFRSYQCGLCHTLGDDYGLAYRVFATPDVVFFNVLADHLRGESPAVGQRRCVVAPPLVASPIPMRERGDNTRFSAAFGVYIGVEKLRDDLSDEGGLHRWMALRLLSRGARKAETVLRSFDFPVDELRTWMDRQAELEARPQAELDEAAQPTMAIARLLAVARVPADQPQRRSWAASVGEHIGAYLFYMDNLLDLPRDLRAGGYNALARRFALEGPEAPISEEVVQAGVSGARAQTEALSGLVATLPLDDHGQYIRHTLSAGFRQKLARLESLAPEQRQKATIKQLRGRHPSHLGRVVEKLRLSALMTVALAVLSLLPDNKWAGGMLAQLVRPAYAGSEIPVPLGSMAATDLIMAAAREKRPKHPVRHWFREHCGWLNCGELGCSGDECNDLFGSMCENGCNNACNDACSNPDCSGCSGC